jgi:hypothetical protein
MSAAIFAQNPNPGSDRARANRDVLDVSPRIGSLGVILQLCHYLFVCDAAE